MNPIEDIACTCPYCSEEITLMIDRSLTQQTYTEDCQVCCCPIIIDVNINADNEIILSTHQENN